MTHVLGSGTRPNAPVDVDRCDRCGARAQATVLIASRTLAFCGHHGRLYRPALLAQGARITIPPD